MEQDTDNENENKNDDNTNNMQRTQSFDDDMLDIESDSPGLEAGGEPNDNDDNKKKDNSVNPENQNSNENAPDIMQNEAVTSEGPNEVEDDDDCEMTQR
eukprot:CAMPEP_0201568740 /NCGR_PEP_ID=MMETSP0190_2-20130828/9963_1 /ASSEMBLY_ACC=CAM_ASM_000263 /TAXON_ID=37353 /ORGANISM="Rosalina sp." /LENGTH=98 /DNA_ID=CAMNT_0047990195 /DNA_START=2332 /DNA_END=2628 /DNA_ORIENTATION=-